MAKPHDLSHIQGTYTRELEQKIQFIYLSYENATVGVNAFKAIVRDAIKDAADTEAKRNFLINLERQKTKDAVLTYVVNAYMRGSAMGVSIYDKFKK